MFLTMIVEADKNDAASLVRDLTALNLNTIFVTCSNGDDAMEYLTSTEKEMDVFFINTKLPTISGYELAGKIRNHKKYAYTPIVFLAGDNVNRLQTFQKYHCYDVIESPSYENIIIEKVSFLLHSVDARKKAWEKKKTVKFSAREGDVFVDVSNIIALEVVGKDCMVYTTNKTYLLPRKTMYETLGDIDEPYLVRCHKSFAVNVLHMTGLTKKRRNLWEVIYDREDYEVKCLVGGAYYDSVMKYYEKLIDSNRAVENT
ncbi:MAG: LytTR family DNA-binding domain-containing protein [Bacillota bacterium]|nr:LytTR family DNA-binding domain-containing protein [Bacillota bacterium]